jgi:hypothetical protein
MATAADLITRDEATGSRLLSEQLVWVISVKDGKTAELKFETGFVKKHLYTSNKNVLLPGEIQADKDVAKFQKQLDHRSGHVDPALKAKDIDDGKVRRIGGGVALCAYCGHPAQDHRTSKGEFKKAGNGVFGCRHPCNCVGWEEGLSGYEASRVARGKLNTDKVNAPTTNTNTVIWMNNIEREAFRSVVIDSIIARETELAAANKKWEQTTNGEKLTWNFAGSPDSVVVLTDKEPAAWVKRVEAKVGVRKPNPAVPTYTVFHMYP